MQLVDRERAARLMADQEVDVLLAHTQLNAGYLTDFWFHMAASATFPFRTENTLPLTQPGLDMRSPVFV
jgi:hypothetical protein